MRPPPKKQQKKKDTHFHLFISHIVNVTVFMHLKLVRVMLALPALVSWQESEFVCGEEQGGTLCHVTTAALPYRPPFQYYYKILILPRL